MDFVGFDELEESLNKMASDELKQAETNALKSSAQIVHKQQQANWNRSSASGEHIQDNVRIGRVYDVEEGSKITIAPIQRLRWRAMFVEWGTSYQAPQQPVQKSLDMTENNVARTMMKELEKVINL